MGILSTIAELVTSEPRKQRYLMDQRSAIGMAISPHQVGKPQWLQSNIRNYDREAYRKVALIFACIRYVANAAGSAPLRVYEDDSGEGEAIADHPLRTLLANPNLGMGEARFISFLAMVMQVASFGLIEMERDRAGRVIGLWVLRSDWARPIPRSSGIADWEYRIPGFIEPRILKGEDALVVPYADTPDLSYTGIGPLEVVLREAQITNAMTDFLKVFMDRGAMPLYVAIPSDDPKIAAQFNDPAIKEAFWTQWRQRYGGLGRSIEPMLIGGIKDIKQLGFNFDELAYPELNNMTDARICQAFGVPPILVGAQVGLEQATYSNYGQARTSFYEDTMFYFWGRLDDTFTRGLLREFEPAGPRNIAFDTSKVPALRTDVDKAFIRGNGAFQSSVISRHHAQRIMGVPVHGPDEFLIPFNLTAIPNSNGQRSVAHASVQPANASLPLDTGELRQREPRIEVRDGRRYLNLRALSAAEREQRAAIATTNRNAIGALADLIAPKLTVFLDDQESRILNQIAITDRTLPDFTVERRAAETVDWDAEDRALLQLFGAWWQSASDTAKAQAATLLGVDIVWAITNPYLSDLDGVLAQRITGINAQTRADIERILLTLTQQGTTVAEMEAAISGLFAETYASRARTIAQTESMVAFAEASFFAYQASGVVDQVLILDNPQHPESYKGADDGLTCAQRHNLVVPLAQGTFHVRSDHPNGSASMAAYIEPAGEG